MTRAFLGAALLWLAAQAPALADWTYYELDDFGGAGVWQADSSGSYQFDIGCDGFLFEMTFGLFVPPADVARLGDKVAVPVMVVIDGKIFGPIDTNLSTSDDGSKVLSAWEDDDGRVRDVILATADATSRVRVEFLGKSASFGMSGMTDVKGQLLEYCP